MCSTAMPTAAEIDALLAVTRDAGRGDAVSDDAARPATRPEPVVHPTKLRAAPGRPPPRASPARWKRRHRPRAEWLAVPLLPIRSPPGGATVDLHEPDRETVVVTISGGGVDLAVDGTTLKLAGRSSVFEGMPWSAYVPAGRDARITGRPAAGREAVVAIAHAPLSGRDGVATDPIVVGPDDVEIEIRGAGNATRQVNNIMMPAFPADRLLVCEVFTPNGNWSGWPPHKHDVDDFPREAVLEETYYYQMSRPEGWAIQRIYHKDGSRDVFLPVRHGDLVVVDQGYHPFASTQGYDAVLPQRPRGRSSDDGEQRRS